jgi:hypothetical protein
VEEGVGGYYFEICGRRGGGIFCIGTLFIRICFEVNLIVTLTGNKSIMFSVLYLETLVNNVLNSDLRQC